MKNTYLWTERHQGSLKFLLNTYINKERFGVLSTMHVIVASHSSRIK